MIECTDYDSMGNHGRFPKPKTEETPEINIKLEERVVESKVIYSPYMIIETPYMIIVDKNGKRKVWTKDKKKIVLYYLYKITKIKWFIKKYNEQPR